MDDTLDRAFDGKGRKKRGGPEMTNAHAKGAGAAHTRGLSLDLGSPYVLPPGLHGSRESLHSLSRTINQQDDRYRPATTFLGNDGTSMRSYPAGREPDEASSFAGSMAAGRDGMDQGLLKNAAKTSRTTPPPPSLPVLESVGGLEYSPPRSSAQPTVPPARKDSLPAPPQVHLAPSSAGGNEPRDSYVDRDMRRSNNYLGALINAAEPASSGKQEARGQTTQRSTLQSELSEPSRDDPSSFGRVAGGSTRPHHVEPPRSMIASVVNSSASTDLSDEVSRIDDEGHPGRIPPRQSSKQAAEKFTIPSITIPESSAEDSGVGAMGYDVRRLSVGLRPLPPEDATDNPEQRANRIRSFYKEYFEESKAGPPREVPAYYEDYDQAYQGGATYHDVDRREFVTSRAPYAQPVTRRAMTPPPRAPPRQRGGHFPQFSMSGVPSPGPRAFSSASGQYGNGPMARGRAPQRRPAPPPAPLRMLPTPHLMTEDSFAAPIDFAPPSSYKERQAGRPESPLGGLRPFSPSLPAHVPLASSFDDLSVMPSPYVSISSILHIESKLMRSSLDTPSANPAPSRRLISPLRRASRTATLAAVTPAASGAAVPVVPPCRRRSCTACAPAPTASVGCPRKSSAPRARLRCR